MQKNMKNILDRIDYFAEKSVTYMMGLLIIAVFVQVVYRFIIVKFTGISFPYTDEFSRVILIWACYLVIGIGLKEGTHASFNLLVDSLPAFSQKLLYVFNRIIILVFAVIIITQGLGLMKLTENFVTPTLQISVALLYAAPTVGCFLVGLRSLAQILEKCTFSTAGLSSNESQPKKRGV